MSAWTDTAELLGAKVQRGIGRQVGRIVAVTSNDRGDFRFLIRYGGKFHACWIDDFQYRLAPDSREKWVLVDETHDEQQMHTLIRAADEIRDLRERLRVAEEKLASLVYEPCANEGCEKPARDCRVFCGSICEGEFNDAQQRKDDAERMEGGDKP